MIIGEDIRDKVSFLLEEASHKIILSKSNIRPN